MSFLVLGFDLGSREAGVALVDQRGRLHDFDLWEGDQKQPLDIRLRHFWHWVLDTVFHAPARARTRAYQRPIVACEEPFVGYPKPALILAWQLGLVHAVCIQRGLTFLPISPQKAKQALTGRGDATKAQMVKAAEMQFEGQFTEHEADAIGVALAGLAELKERKLAGTSEALSERD